MDVVGFELAESGDTIEFPATVSDKKLDLGDAVIAGHTSENTAVRVQ